MDFNFTDEQKMLRDTVASYLADRYAFEQRKAAGEQEPGWRPEVWKGFAEELGILGASFPEELGGLGGGPGPKPRTNPNGPKMYRTARPDDQTRRFNDPLHVFARYRRAQAKTPGAEREIKLHELDRRALETLGFSGNAKAVEIKQAYKALVKIHHPDINGGDKSSEERLRAIIAAYTHLKTKGFVS